MTGFGKATVDCGTKKVIVEVKSLNSKQLDINLRTPSIYKEKDIEIRNMIKNVLERGRWTCISILIMRRTRKMLP